MHAEQFIIHQLKKNVCYHTSTNFNKCSKQSTIHESYQTRSGYYYSCCKECVVELKVLVVILPDQRARSVLISGGKLIIAITMYRNSGTSWTHVLGTHPFVHWREVYRV